MDEKNGVEAERFCCLENLNQGPAFGAGAAWRLVHCGEERCRPLHTFQGVRDEYILHVVRKGQGVFSDGKTQLPVRAGQMFLIRPGVPVLYTADREDPWTYAWVGFLSDAAEDFFAAAGLFQEGPVQTVPGDPEEVISAIEEMLSCREETMECAFERSALLYHLLGLLGKREERNAGRSPGRRYAVDAAAYIRLHYADALRVEDIAGALGISRAYLNRCFQEREGCSVQAYLIRCRMRAAASLLQTTDLPVGEIGAAAGYEDPLNFSRAFHRFFGMSPRAYRQGKDHSIIEDIEERRN